MYYLPSYEDGLDGRSGTVPERTSLKSLFTINQKKSTSDVMQL
jgi:hypothetical protein